MLSMDDDGDFPSPPSTPSGAAAESDSFSCDEDDAAGSDLDRYCSASSVLDRSSLASSMGYRAADFLDAAGNTSDHLSPTLRLPSNGGNDSISISGDDCSDREAHSDDESPRGLNGFGNNNYWHGSRNRRSSILMDSSVAFGEDDWDEFMLERGDDSNESAPVYLLEMESIRSKQQPGCSSSSEQQQQLQLLSDVKKSEPVLGISGGDSESGDGDGNQIVISKANENVVISKANESVERKDEGMKLSKSEELESRNGNYEGKEMENGHDIAMAGGKDKEFEMEMKGIDGIDQANKNVTTENSLDDMVLEMEEILLDSESHSPKSITDYNPYKSHASTMFLHESRGGSSSASTSGTDERNPKTIDSVEITGAKQRKGDVSFGERLVGVKEYTVYIFKVRSGTGSWEVERRYREFYILYRQLKALFTAHGLILPLPWSLVERESKKMFGNSSPTVISDRSVLLQECLSSVLTTNYPFGIPSPLFTFLSPGKFITATLIPTNSPPTRNIISSDSMGKKISLILEIRAHKSVTQLLELQHHTCAGCHRLMHSESTFLKDFAQTVGWSQNYKLCEYTGQLFCNVCHVNDTSVIPGRVLHSWDFTLYPVSQLAKAYLESINDQPMLCVSAVNPFLFSRVPALLHIMGLRKKISAMLPYIICPFRKSVEKGLGTRRYLLECNDFFALRDLVDLSKGVFAGFPVLVERLHKKIEEHITQQCLVCYDAGVPCAARSSCHDPFSLIFPFQETEAEKCSICGSIYHANCFMSLDGCSCKRANNVGQSRPSDGLVNRLTFSSSHSTSGFFSDLISKARPDKIWKPRNKSPIILMGSLPGGTSL